MVAGKFGKTPVLARDPTSALEPTTKQYVDSRTGQLFNGVVPPGSPTTIITHNLGTTNVDVTVRDATGAEVGVPNRATSSSQVTLYFTDAPTTNQYTVRVDGGMSGGGYTPPPNTLADAASIATDATLGSHFRVTLAGNRTLSNPTNPTDGQKIVWELIQDATGSRTITLDTAFALGSDISTVTLTTTPSKRDFLGAVYNATTAKWYVIAFAKGY